MITPDTVNTPGPGVTDQAGLHGQLRGTWIVWLGCLVWAFGAVHKSAIEDGTDGGESGLNLFANGVKKVEFSGPSELRTVNEVEQLERLKQLLDTDTIKVEFDRLKTRIVGPN